MCLIGSEQRHHIRRDVFFIVHHPETMQCYRLVMVVDIGADVVD